MHAVGMQCRQPPVESQHATGATRMQENLKHLHVIIRSKNIVATVTCTGFPLGAQTVHNKPNFAGLAKKAYVYILRVAILSMVESVC